MSGSYVNASMECPDSVRGILDMVRRTLQHDVRHVTIRPGVSIDVNWRRQSIDEELLAPTSGVTVDQILSVIEVNEFRSKAGPRETLFSVLHGLGYKGVIPNFLITSDVEGLAEEFSLLTEIPLPQYGADQLPMICGVPAVEVGEDLMPEGRYVLFAGPEKSDDLSVTTYAVMVTL